MKMTIRKFSSPDDKRTFGHGRLELLQTADGAVGRATFEKGWRWSTDVKPLAGTRSCEVAHTGYCISGRMRIRMDDGEEAEMGPGDFMMVPPGHDAWTVGDEACVVVDWQGMAEYARQRGTATTTARAPETDAPAHH